jgi:hypothetical protein
MRRLDGFSKVLDAWYNGESKTIKNDRTDGKTITYYWTDIIGRDERGVYVQHGGFVTTATKNRINHLASVHVYQKDFDWYIATPGSHGEYFPFEGKVYINEMPVSSQTILESLGVV